MPRVKSASELARGEKNPWLETFSIAYGLYDMAHKVKTRNMQARNYVTNSIDSIYKSASEAKDEKSLDFGIGRLENILGNTRWNVNDAESQRAIGQLESLRQRREDVISLNSWSNELDTKYDKQMYVNIPNRTDWETPSGEWKKKKDGAYEHTSAHRKGPSNTKIRINDDIKELESQVRYMRRSGVSDDQTIKDFEGKINELKNLRSYVGYDGKITQLDISHFDSAKDLSTKYKEWTAEYKTAQNAAQFYTNQIADAQKEPMKFDTVNIAELKTKKVMHEEKAAQLRSVLDRYVHDYTGLPDPVTGGMNLESKIDDVIHNLEETPTGMTQEQKDFEAEEDKEFSDWIEEGDSAENNEEGSDDEEGGDDNDKIKVSESGVFQSQGIWLKNKDGEIVKATNKEIQAAKKELNKNKELKFGNWSNKRLRRLINQAFLSIPRKDREKFDKKYIMSTIKAGRVGDEKYKESTLDIPEEILQLLDTKWQKYVKVNRKITP
jgi:hypothetical protein